MVMEGRVLKHSTWADLLFCCQVEFNKTVIQMLTDLDYRKSES